jgi:hypothetical protein
MTNLSEIYDIFLSKISDYNLVNLLPEEVEEELLGYFKSARTKFYKCKKDKDGNDRLKLSDDDTEVTGDLTYYEMEILVKLMLVEYMTPILLSSEVLKQGLSDKDFKIYSQANQLRELNLLYRLLQKEANKMITEYTYMGMTEND